MFKDCYFHEHDDKIKDRIVLRTSSKDLPAKIFSEDEWTLDKAKKIAQVHEMTKTQMKARKRFIQSKMVKEKLLRLVKKNQEKRINKKTSIPAKESSSRCRREHSRDDMCPGNGKVCSKCHKREYFEQMCSSSLDANVQGIDQALCYGH